MMSEAQLRKRIRQRCQEHGTQKELAARLGVSKVSLSMFLTGKRPPSERLLRVFGYERVKLVRYRQREGEPEEVGR